MALVASSVEGLQADQVTVVDTSGQMLSSNSSGVGEDIASQYEYKRQVEADLAAQAEYMLTNMLGVGKAVVRSSGRRRFHAHVAGIDDLRSRLEGEEEGENQ